MNIFPFSNANMFAGTDFDFKFSISIEQPHKKTQLLCMDADAYIAKNHINILNIFCVLLTRF